MLISLSLIFAITGYSDVCDVITVEIAKFFTRPIEPPSGVSGGQIIPHCVLCSFLGGTNFEFFSVGVLTRLKCNVLELNGLLCPSPWNYWFLYPISCRPLETDSIVVDFNILYKLVELITFSMFILFFQTR